MLASAHGRPRPAEADVLLAASRQADAPAGPRVTCIAGSASWRGSRRLRFAAALVTGGLIAGLLASAAFRPKTVVIRPGLSLASEADAAGNAPCIEKSGPCITPVELFEEDVDWEVEYEGTVNVYRWQSTSAPVLMKKWKCTILRGRREDDWVKLVDEPGFIPLTQDNSTTMKPIPVYSKIANGTCEDVGMYPVRDAFTCGLAAKAMNLPDTKLEEIMLVPLPEGCHMFAGERSTGLYLSTNPLNKGNGAARFHEPICSSYEEPSKQCTPPTTTQTMTSTTTTWGWPSLFCVTMGLAAGYETQLLKEQLDRRAGVFACDEFAVFSAGEALALGRWAGRDFYTTGLPEDASRALTNSSFMLSWSWIKEDGRFRRHDWTVRVSPETVFFPERLRLHVNQHTPAGGVRLFFQKCDRFNPSQLYGLIEVRSRPAIDAYFSNEEKCKAALPWQGWYEEEFFQKCLEWIKVGSVFDENLLQDTSCGSVNCQDKSKVAFHDFHDMDSYLNCWRLASQ